MLKLILNNQIYNQIYCDHQITFLRVLKNLKQDPQYPKLSIHYEELVIFYFSN